MELSSLGAARLEWGTENHDGGKCWETLAWLNQMGYLDSQGSVTLKGRKALEDFRTKEYEEIKQRVIAKYKQEKDTKA